MTPERLAVPVVEPVSRSGVAFAGRLRAETFTATSRPDTLARSVETPAQATNQLDDALSVFCYMCEVTLESIVLNLLLN